MRNSKILYQLTASDQSELRILRDCIFWITSLWIIGVVDNYNSYFVEHWPINFVIPVLALILIKLISFDSILVEGCHPYAEDLWKTIKINKLTFRGVKLCGRCKVKTPFFQINPPTYFIDQNEGCKKHCYPKHPWHTRVSSHQRGASLCMNNINVL